MTKDSKLIASGTYGCVVIPPITKSIAELKKYTNKSKDDIGKLFKATGDSKKEALKEYSKYKESVENVLYYTKIVPKIKGYNIINNITDTQIHNCLFLDDYDEDIHQLIYENAGITAFCIGTHKGAKRRPSPKCKNPAGSYHLRKILNIS